MMHGSRDFTAHVLDLLKNSGPTGPSGPTAGKALISNDKVGTSRRDALGPVENEWSQHARASGPSKNCEKQSLTGAGTSGTTGTSLFAWGEDQSDRGGSTSEWHAILAELKEQNCPDWLATDRWNGLVSDAEIFLNRWSHVAHQLGWTALDLFGVHPAAPASRFDAMGLFLLIGGGEVIALTASSATIQRRSGAVLTYRRSDHDEAVLMSKVRS
jgi:hypothetical protein